MKVQLEATQPLYSDNLSALHLTANLVFHARSKHIELDFHYVSERVAYKLLLTEFIPSTEQLADIFTKPVSSDLHLKFVHKLQLLPKHCLRGDIEVFST